MDNLLKLFKVNPAQYQIQQQKNKQKNMEERQKIRQAKQRSFPLQITSILISLISVFANQHLYFKQGLWMMHFSAILAIFLIEGGKAYSPLYPLAFLFSFLQYRWIQLLFTIASAWCYYKFKFYQIKIVDQGKYQAGFRNVTIGTQSLAIFYPTLQKGEPALWIQTKDYFKTLYDLTYMNPLKKRWIPLSVFKIFTSYMSRVKIPVQTNTKLVTSNPESFEFQVIIFSHGLSSNMTTYSSYCCWLASQGYIVVSIQHVNDFVRVGYDQQFYKRRNLMTKVHYTIGNEGLKARTDEMESVYRSLINRQLLKYAFPQIEAIGLKKVHFFGHSFGGATCIQSLANLSNKKVDLSLVDQILTIDPFFFPLSKHTYEHSFSHNITIVNTETFINVVPPQFQLKRLLKQFIQKNCGKVLPYVIMGSDHSFCTDFPRVCGNGITLITRFKDFTHRDTFLAMLETISYLTLKGCGKEMVLKAAGEQFSCKQLVKKNILIVEETRFFEK